MSDPLHLGQFSQNELLEKWFSEQPDELEFRFNPNEPIFIPSSDSGVSGSSFDFKHDWSDDGVVTVVVKKNEDTSFWGAVVDCIPFVGSLKQVFELIEILEDDERTRGEVTWKVVSCGVSIAADGLTFGLMSGGLKGLKVGLKLSKTTSRIVLQALKKHQTAIGCTVAARAAVVRYANSKSQEAHKHNEKMHAN